MLFFCLSAALTAMPRWTAGRAAFASSQRFMCANGSMSWPCRSQSRAQGKDAMSAIE